MKACALVPGQVGPERLVGRVLCHDVREAGRIVLRKGQVLDLEATRLLAETAVGEVHVIELEPGDLHEDPAGERVASAVAGPGVAVRDAAAGQWALVAMVRGLLRVATGALAGVNALEGIAVYTLFDGQVVEAGEVVARAKVTPLAVPEAVVREAEARARAARGVVAVRPFRPLPVGAVAPASLAPRARARFEAALGEKLGWFGAPLVRLEYADGTPRALGSALASALDAGAELVIAAGANALDPLDPVFQALDAVGARLVRRGVPAHPGSLLWLAEVGTRRILGMPSCGMFSQGTVFDLILPRILAGEPVGADELAGLGHGGLLGAEMAFRFPPYRAGQLRGTLPE